MRSKDTLDADVGEVDYAKEHLLGVAPAAAAAAAPDGS